MAYSGEIRFISDNTEIAVVKQTLSGSSYEDGYRIVRADFSAKAVGDVITYDYTTNGEYGYSITIS